MNTQPMDNRTTSPTSLQRARILLVQNLPPHQSRMHTTLASLGCQVSVATTGREALSLATQNPFDLILLDSGIAGIDAMTVARILRQTHSLGRAVPILEMVDDPAQPVAGEPFDAIVGKQTSAQELCGLLSRWLGQSVP